MCTNRVAQKRGTIKIYITIYFSITFLFIHAVDILSKFDNSASLS